MIESPELAPTPSDTTDAPCRLTVDLGAIVANWRKLQGMATPAACAAVIKADGYGCGLQPVASALSRAGCIVFFVATLEEAARARAVLPETTAIFVLDGILPGTAARFGAINAKPVLGSMPELLEWEAYRLASNWPGGAAIHVDTGMNRLGFTAEDMRLIAPRFDGSDHRIDLIMSHLACAETPSHAMNAAQLQLFGEIRTWLPGVPASLANSSGIFLGPDYHFDLVRPGAALYGVNPASLAFNPMQPVVTLEARVLQVRRLAAGESVGYGATWKAMRPSEVAIVAAGYGDGLLRAASASERAPAQAMVGNVLCPVIGRISMDLLAVDATDAGTGKLRRGDNVQLLGERNTVDDLARAAGTIGYEVLTHLGQRPARVYRQPAAEAATPAPPVIADPADIAPAPTEPA